MKKKLVSCFLQHATNSTIDVNLWTNQHFQDLEKVRSHCLRRTQESIQTIETRSQQGILGSENIIHMRPKLKIATNLVWVGHLLGYSVLESSPNKTIFKLREIYNEQRIVSPIHLESVWPGHEYRSYKECSRRVDSFHQVPCLLWLRRHLVLPSLPEYQRVPSVRSLPYHLQIEVIYGRGSGLQFLWCRNCSFS